MTTGDIHSLLATKAPVGLTPSRSYPEGLSGKVFERGLPAGDKVDLGSLPFETSPPSGRYDRSFTYEEEVSYFRAEGSLAYEGADGTKVLLDFSFQSMTKKVHYEMTQSIASEDSAAHSHPVHDDFGPKATAGRIVNYARGLLNKFRAMEGDDPQKLADFIRQLVGAIKKGFRGLDKVFGAGPRHVGDMAQETFDRVMRGMAALDGELGVSQENVRKVTYDQEISIATASVEISVMA